MTTIRVLTETIIGFAAAAASLPGAKGATHCARFTRIRWVKKGVRGVKLEAVKVGNSWVTSQEALARFFAATTAQAGGTTEPERTPAQRTKDSMAAIAQLKAAGW